MFDFEVEEKWRKANRKPTAPRGDMPQRDGKEVLWCRKEDKKPRQTELAFSAPDHPDKWERLG